jgi:hypothetical protein
MPSNRTGSQRGSVAVGGDVSRFFPNSGRASPVDHAAKRARSSCLVKAARCPGGISASRVWPGAGASFDQYEPRIGSRRRRVWIPPSLGDRDAFHELRHNRWRVFGEQAPVSLGAFEPHATHQQRDALPGELKPAQGEVQGEIERRIGDDPIDPARRRLEHVDAVADE